MPFTSGTISKWKLPLLTDGSTGISKFSTRFSPEVKLRGQKKRSLWPFRSSTPLIVQPSTFFMSSEDNTSGKVMEKLAKLRAGKTFLPKRPCLTVRSGWVLTSLLPRIK